VIEEAEGFGISESRGGYGKKDGQMNQVELSTQQLDPLGIVVGICQQIDLVGQIDRIVGANGCKMSVSWG